MYAKVEKAPIYTPEFPDNKSGKKISSKVRQKDADSLDVQVVVEQREYRDSIYRARVSGPRIGELRPTLDFIETYARTTERERILTKRSRFAVTAGVGVGYTPQGFQPHIGVSVGVVLWGF